MGLDMRKRKNGERNYRKILFRISAGLVIVCLVVLFTPMIYTMMTYYNLSDDYDKVEISKWYVRSDVPYEICRAIGNIPFYPMMPPSLKARFVIDDEVVPFSQVHVIDIDNIAFQYEWYPMSDDIACTTQPELTGGEHEAIVFINYSSNLQWQVQGRWNFHVDEAGQITDAKPLCVL